MTKKRASPWARFRRQVHKCILWALTRSQNHLHKKLCKCRRFSWCGYMAKMDLAECQCRWAAHGCTSLECNWHHTCIPTTAAHSTASAHNTGGRPGCSSTGCNGLYFACNQACIARSTEYGMQTGPRSMLSGPSCGCRVGLRGPAPERVVCSRMMRWIHELPTSRCCWRCWMRCTEEMLSPAEALAPHPPAHTSSLRPLHLR